MYDIIKNIINKVYIPDIFLIYIYKFQIFHGINILKNEHNKSNIPTNQLNII